MYMALWKQGLSLFFYCCIFLLKTINVHLDDSMTLHFDMPIQCQTHVCGKNHTSKHKGQLKAG